MTFFFQYGKMLLSIGKEDVEMFRRLSTYILSALGIFSLGYYSYKFYLNKKLELSDEPMFLWISVFVILLVSLALGIYNAWCNQKLRKQQSELIDTIRLLIDKQDENCADLLESIYNSRDIELDVFNLIKEKEKGN